MVVVFHTHFADCEYLFVYSKMLVSICFFSLSITGKISSQGGYPNYLLLRFLKSNWKSQVRDGIYEPIG